MDNGSENLTLIAIAEGIAIRGGGGWRYGLYIAYLSYYWYYPFT